MAWPPQMARVSLFGMVIWNGNDYYGQAVWEIHVMTSMDLTAWDDKGWLYFNPLVGTPQWDHFAVATMARYVQWAWYEDDGNGFSAEVNEVAFTGSAAPEPVSWTLAGLGIVLLACLRRKHCR